MPENKSNREALPDWRGQSTSLGKLSADQVAQLVDRVSAFLSARKQNNTQKPPPLSARHLANKYFVLGEDQALRVAVGFGLDRWQVDEAGFPRKPCVH